MFLYLLSWLAAVVQILFLTLSIAAGLYYLADLIEEYTSAAARVIRYLIWAVLLIHVGLFVFEEMSSLLLLSSFICHCLYYSLLNTFPLVELSSPWFISSVGLLILNHVMAFSHFSTVYHPFSEVLAFFTLCLWLVPFMFFVSLSANDLVLPSVADRGPSDPQMGSDDALSDYFNRRGNKKYGLMSFFKYAHESILPQRIKKKY